VIADVEGLMKTPLQQAGFRLETENALTEPFLYDREIMVQVLINLIENSVKFGQSSPAKRITLRLRPAGDHVRIEVADTGPGIPDGMLKRSSTTFTAPTTPVTAAAGGTGIGLALVRRFVMLLGGRVWAANNPVPAAPLPSNCPRNAETENCY